MPFHFTDTQSTDGFKSIVAAFEHLFLVLLILRVHRNMHGGWVHGKMDGRMDGWMWYVQDVLVDK